MRRLLSIFALAGMLGQASAQTTSGQGAPENTGANANIVRWARGEILYQTLADKRHRGQEQWQLFVHPDQTRTLITHNDIYARNAVMTAVIRVQADFYPIESYASYWNDGRFKGGGVFRVHDGILTADITGPTGQFQQTIAVDKARLSLLVHPLAPDGWHGGSYDKAKGGAQTIPMINIDAISTWDRPVLGSRLDQTWELKGTEQVTVPAGTFAAEHYRANDFDVWVTGPDRILVKYVWSAVDREYLLTRFETGP
ncbi:MAG: hypothetical protein SFV19_07155 [Rhodospirillaceae bacterium]|nr:hypothetical protein [Rhodospirillaceae bacterium]